MLSRLTACQTTHDTETYILTHTPDKQEHFSNLLAYKLNKYTSQACTLPLCLIYVIYILYGICNSARCVCALSRTQRPRINSHLARILLHQLPVPERPPAWQQRARARASGRRQNAREWQHTRGELPCAAARAAHQTMPDVSDGAARRRPVAWA